MRERAPRALVERCLAAVGAALDEEAPSWWSDAALVEAARAMSLAFTDERAAPSTPPATDEIARAYLAYFAPRTLAALAAALAGGPVPERAVDVGAGTGAASLVLAAAGVRELLLVDRDPRALERACALVRRVDSSASVKAMTVTGLGAPLPERWRGAPLFSAFAAYELARGRGAGALLDDVLALAPDAPRVLLLDAGDRRRARLLQEVRAAALARGCFARAPCPHDDACPALERERDWCHLVAPRFLDERFASFAAAVGRDPERVAFGFVDLVRERAAPVERARVLVIGEPRREKGRARLPVCGAGGLRFLQAKRRDRAAHDALLAIERGALLEPVAPLEQRGDTAHVDDAAALRCDTPNAKLAP